MKVLYLFQIKYQKLVQWNFRNNKRTIIKKCQLQYAWANALITYAAILICKH